MDQHKNKGSSPGRRSFTAPKAQHECDEWNRQYPVGTEVIRTDTLDREHLTKTRSSAQVTKGRAEIWVEDTLPYYPLERIKPRKCRVCGCTTFHGCRAPLDFEACQWVEKDLCSACLGKDVHK